MLLKRIYSAVMGKVFNKGPLGQVSVVSVFYILTNFLSSIIDRRASLITTYGFLSFLI